MKTLKHQLSVTRNIADGLQFMLDNGFVANYLTANGRKKWEKMVYENSKLCTEIQEQLLNEVQDE